MIVSNAFLRCKIAQLCVFYCAVHKCTHLCGKKRVMSSSGPNVLEFHNDKKHVLHEISKIYKLQLCIFFFFFNSAMRSTFWYLMFWGRWFFPENQTPTQLYFFLNSPNDVQWRRARPTKHLRSLWRCWLILCFVSHFVLQIESVVAKNVMLWWEKKNIFAFFFKWIFCILCNVFFLFPVQCFSKNRVGQKNKCTLSKTLHFYIKHNLYILSCMLLFIVVNVHILKLHIIVSNETSSRYRDKNLDNSKVLYSIFGMFLFY